MKLEARELSIVTSIRGTKAGGDALLAEATPPAAPRSYAQAQAVRVLVHESVHVSTYRRTTTRALTECRAIQLIHTAALTFGRARATIRALGHEALRADSQLPGPGDWRVGPHEIPTTRPPAVTQAARSTSTPTRTTGPTNVR